MSTHVSLLQERMREPLHLGRMDDASVSASVGNPACGDVLTLHLRIDGGRIGEARFESLGSAYQLATASVLCDAIVGQPVEAASRLAPDALLDRLHDLPQPQHYLARLAIDALRRAVDDWQHGSRPDAPHRPIDDAGCRAFVRRVLGTGRRWSTGEIQSMAAAEAVAWPCPTVKFLSLLRREGIIQGEMDVGQRTWVWWI